MRMVIDIDENVFTRLFDNGTEDYEIVNDDLFAIAKAIRGGTPLPKGHGRLIDADALEYSCEFEKCVQQTGIGCNHCQYHTITEYEIDNAHTIIEADKEGE